MYSRRILQQALSVVLRSPPRQQFVFRKAMYPAAQFFVSSTKPLYCKAEPFLDPNDVKGRVIEVVRNFDKVGALKVTDTARFKEDLDLDSLDAVEIVMAIEEEFGVEIPDSEADKILSIADAVAYISGHPMAK
eukprot:CAMPEP_0182419072 /NCGR_PEP_ID=MMETSP1167-20130531/3468_1 /TAXON_ID=2988 /ORGANISM="Mallomonas Sp, Strain CCMP3275" /LENGTH=132 /DNA_ID=CAMNT_0024593679 /DNA_START=67 /DNA_END=465 /DNA_ORIENTATION=-